MSVGDRRGSIRRIALLFPLFACLVASEANAAGSGINLSWDDCGAFGAAQKTFSCSGAASSRVVLVASAIAGLPMPKLVAQYAVLEVQASSNALSPWWQLSSGGCRGASPSPLRADFDFTSGGSCVDPWSGGAVGGLSFDSGYGGADRARIRIICAIPASTSITGSDEYAYFKLALSNARGESCAGCSDGVCIALDSIELDQTKGTGDFVLTTPIARSFVQWQSGARSTSHGGACSGAVVQSSTTWGGLKSMYH